MNTERSQTFVRLIAVALCTLGLAWLERSQTPAREPLPVASVGKTISDRPAR